MNFQPKTSPHRHDFFEIRRILRPALKTHPKVLRNPRGSVAQTGL
jgi:hypothetical protein